LVGESFGGSVVKSFGGSVQMLVRVVQWVCLKVGQSVDGSVGGSVRRL